MKINSDICKDKIIELCSRRETFEEMSPCFIPPLTEKDWEKTKNKNNWKRISKTRISKDGEWERSFDNIKFDSELRAYVITSPTDEEFTDISIAAE